MIEIEHEPDTRERLKDVALRGVAVPFGVLSHEISDSLGDGYTEIVLPGAFDDVLKRGGPVSVTFLHSGGLELASTSNGTLKLWTTSIGLQYRFSLPQTALGFDVLEFYEAGMTGCSFRGIAADRREENGRSVIHRFAYLEEITLLIPPAFPAYPGTSIEKVTDSNDPRELRRELKRRGL